jgi:hypothetical protein
MHNFEQKMKFNWFFVLIFVSCLIVIVFAFYSYFYKKNFDFIVEVACDPLVEECLLRDCSSGECPPNNLEIFKRYVLSAADFQFCENEDCQLVCENNLIECELIPCEENFEFGETCSIKSNFLELEETLFEIETENNLENDTLLIDVDNLNEEN